MKFDSLPTQIHHDFKNLVDSLLTEFVTDLGVSIDSFYEVIAKEHESDQLTGFVVQTILTVDDFLLFKAMMVKRNIDLTNPVEVTAAACCTHTRGTRKPFHLSGAVAFVRVCTRVQLPRAVAGLHGKGSPGSTGGRNSPGSFLAKAGGDLVGQFCLSGVDMVVWVGSAEPQRTLEKRLDASAPQAAPRVRRAHVS